MYDSFMFAFFWFVSLCSVSRASIFVGVSCVRVFFVCNQKMTKVTTLKSKLRGYYRCDMKTHATYVYIYIRGWTCTHIYLCICLSKYLSTCLPVCLRACLSCVYSPHPPHLSRAPYVIYLLYPIDLIQSNPQSISIQSSSERYASATFQQIKASPKLFVPCHPGHGREGT